MALDDVQNEATAAGIGVWVTGIGLVSSLGEGGEAHWLALNREAGDPEAARVDSERFAPYPVHPLSEVDLAGQIPSKTDLRQMGAWQCLGTYAAGLALDDAGFSDRDMRAAIHLNVAAGNGERDSAADAAVLAELSASPTQQTDDRGAGLNGALLRSLRPTLYLSELSNLLAGNISIVHGVTASSRTFKGEEMAGVAAVEDAVGRIRAGTGEVFLVGGACNAERADLMLNLELCGAMWQGGHRSVWERAAEGGGIVLGSVGAFLVLEAEPHARARGREPYAKVTTTTSGRDSVPVGLGHLECDDAPCAVLSGASGAEPATGQERSWLEGLGRGDDQPIVRGFGTRLGHAIEAQFPLGVALAALALSQRQLYGPFDTSGFEIACETPVNSALVTTFAHWRGAGMALLEAVTQSR